VVDDPQVRLFRLAPASPYDDGTDGAARCTVGVLLMARWLLVYCALSCSLVESWAT